MPDHPTVRDQTHSDYDLHISTWRKCRDARAGEDHVKARGVVYLPKLDGQNDDQYAAYKMRGRFFNAFGKTIDGHIGLATRKETIVEAPDAMDDLLRNVDKKGSGMPDHIKSALREVLEVNRCGTLVDFDQVPEGATVAEAGDARPYLILYKAEDIRDWEYDEDNKLIYVLLRERIRYRGNRVEGEKVYRYRECEILEGVYVQKVWEDGEPEAVEEFIPRLNFEPLDFIPFTIHQSEFDQEISEPPLIDLVNLCFSHYRLKADHAHALHYVALPTPWITGVDKEDAPKTIGPEKVWAISSPDAAVGMLEFTGEGVRAIADELKSQEDQMAILGSRVLLPEMAEHTATASKLRSISETSDLATIVLTLEKQFRWVLAFYTIWGGAATEDNAEEATDVDMPTDFMPSEMDSAMVTAMVAAWQAGAFDWATLIRNFQKAEIVEADVDMVELQAAIESEDEERMQKAAEAVAASAQLNPPPGDQPQDDDEQ
jgi:hypothetical protein